MYSTNANTPWRDASEKPVPQRGDYPLSEKAQGKQRQRSAAFEDGGVLPYARHAPTPTPASSPTPRTSSAQDMYEKMLSVNVDVPLKYSREPTNPLNAAGGYVATPRFAPTLPPIPPSPPQQRFQQSASDPSHFKISDPTRPTRPLQISAPLHPRVSDVSVHVEKDHQRALPTFDFEMHFRVTLSDREMPQ